MTDYLEYVEPCECCGQRFCTIHNMHWADCDCPGPHDDDDLSDEVENT